MADPELAEPPVRLGVAGLITDHVWAMVEALTALPAVSLAAIGESDAELAEQASARYPQVARYPDAAAVLDHDGLDAIVLCVDNAAKADIAERALGQGIAVYSDKPLAATGDQALRIHQAVQRTGGLLMCAFHTAFDTGFEEVGALVREGLLGTVQFARGLAGHAGLAAMGVSPQFGEWLTDPARNGGGSFVDQAGYLITTFQRYLGPVAEVSGMAASFDPATPDGIEDNTAALLRLSSGALATIDTRWGQVGPAPLRYSFHGTEATLTVYGDRYELVTKRPDGPPGWEKLGTDGGLTNWRLAVTPRAGYDEEARHFIAVLRGAETLRETVTTTSALAVQRVIDAYYAAVAEGTNQRVEQLVG